MQTFLVPSNTPDDVIKELNKLYSANYVRVEPMPTYPNKIQPDNWKTNLKKNGVYR